MFVFSVSEKNLVLPLAVAREHCTSNTGAGGRAGAGWGVTACGVEVVAVAFDVIGFGDLRLWCVFLACNAFSTDGLG